MTTNRENHGGARPGAGRKQSGTVRLEVRPKKETAERMRRKATEEKKTFGQLLDEKF